MSIWLGRLSHHWAEARTELHRERVTVADQQRDRAAGRGDGRDGDLAEPSQASAPFFPRPPRSLAVITIQAAIGKRTSAPVSVPA